MLHECWGFFILPLLCIFRKSKKEEKPTAYGTEEKDRTGEIVQEGLWKELIRWSCRRKNKNKEDEWTELLYCDSGSCQHFCLYIDKLWTYLQIPCYIFRKSSVHYNKQHCTCVASNMNSQCSVACKLLSTIRANLLFFSCVSLHGVGKDKNESFSTASEEVKYGIF